MQFNSFVFILMFLPITVLAYFLANKWKPVLGKLVLAVASVVFYAYSDWTLFTVLGISLVVNLAFSWALQRLRPRGCLLLIVPVLINVGLLLYFKYTNFLIGTVNQFAGTAWAVRDLVQPLGISFFTFQQIAYLVSVCKGEIDRVAPLDYLCYILYFPKILMGPLMDPADFLGQLNDLKRKQVNMDHLANGLQIFSFGLFKKVMLADVFAKGVSWGFSNLGSATAMDLLLVTLFYTFEIYFDFSGYSDMAVGVSQMLNITLPINFDSPYKALSIRDFWKRWHISLTKFFTKYVYIPLGGSRKGQVRTYLNTMLIFLISGLWHGANFTFILWGLLHGGFMVLDRIFGKAQEKVFEPVRWFVTFCILNVLWLLFRAGSIGQWISILKTILLMQDTSISDGLIRCFTLPEMPFLVNMLPIERLQAIRGFWMILYALFAMGICLIPENNYKNLEKRSVCRMLLAAVAFVWGFICLSSESVFVYFNF